MVESINKIVFLSVLFSSRMPRDHCVHLLEFAPHFGEQWSKILVSNRNSSVSWLCDVNTVSPWNWMLNETFPVVWALATGALSWTQRSLLWDTERGGRVCPTATDHSAPDWTQSRKAIVVNTGACGVLRGFSCHCLLPFPQPLEVGAVEWGSWGGWETRSLLCRLPAALAPASRMRRHWHGLLGLDMGVTSYWVPVLVPHGGHGRMLVGPPGLC